MKRFGRRRLGITPITLLFLVGSALTDRSGVCIATVLAALVHEGGHLAAALCMGIPLSCIRFDLFGARITVADRLLSYGEEWLLCAAGPLASLFLAPLLYPLWGISRFAVALSAASLLLGLLNLLPVRSFDGGRMAEVTLCRIFGARAAFFAMSALTLAVLFWLWALSVYFLLRSGGGISLFCFSLGLFVRFLESGKIG